ncbi:MAG TPA: 4,5-DOPA dioxygenase extradiol [Bacteroidia bacterium]|nr:4,5-DOPA dioxygenase extradiol [Bacteroidia bacterium]
MDRRLFIKNIGITAIAMSGTNTILKNLHNLEEQNDTLPVLFIGHGSPMNALENNEFSNSWDQLGKNIARPKAILCVSAHWETQGTKVTAMAQPKTIHDFGGFPKELFDKEYPAPGSPDFAKLTASEIKKTHVELDQEWGLDHGSWSVLCRMYPLADIPCFQLSLDYTKPPLYHYDLAKELLNLRKKGVLIIGSGNVVHNLGLLRFNNPAFEWASEFDAKIKNLILEGNHNDLINYSRFGRMAELSIPTNEHYLPLLYTLALQQKNEKVTFFNESTVLGSISMRSLIISGQ